MRCHCCGRPVRMRAQVTDMEHVRSGRSGEPRWFASGPGGHILAGLAGSTSLPSGPREKAGACRDGAFLYSLHVPVVNAGRKSVVSRSWLPAAQFHTPTLGAEADAFHRRRPTAGFRSTRPPGDQGSGGAFGDHGPAQSGRNGRGCGPSLRVAEGIHRRGAQWHERQPDFRAGGPTGGRLCGLPAGRAQGARGHSRGGAAAQRPGLPGGGVRHLQGRLRVGEHQPAVHRGRDGASVPRLRRASAGHHGALCRQA